MSDTPREVELKLALAPGEAARVAALPVISGTRPRRTRMVAFYLDTPQRELARNGLGLRLRREGRHWRAALKASGRVSGGLHERSEWEFAVPGPVLDLTRFAETPLAAIARADTLHSRLLPIVVTEMHRTRWRVEPAPGTRLEIALDEGRLLARGRERPVCELEIEVLEGPAHAAFDLAETMALNVAMRPEPATKLARGLALASGARPQPVRAAAVDIADAKELHDAARCIVYTCLAHVQGNEAGVLESGDIEFVHQLRVALRRLRCAVRLFAKPVAPAQAGAFAADLRWAATTLGHCRNWDVFVTETLPPLLRAYGDGKTGKAILARARKRQRDARGSAREAILSARYGLAMVRVGRWAHGLDAPPAPSQGLKDFASERLRKGAKRIRRATEAFGTLDAAARHALRIDVKRQRYAVDFFGTLFRAGAASRHARRLALAQEALGLANDCANALAHVAELTDDANLLAFARGWFAAREASGIETAAGALARAARERRFWRRKPRAGEPPAPA
jgi:inorganic triphosphatase YgiF